MMIDLNEGEVVLSSLIVSGDGYKDIVRGRVHLFLSLDTINHSLLRYACMPPEEKDTLRYWDDKGNISLIGWVYFNSIRLVKYEDCAFLVGRVALHPDCKLTINDIIFRVAFTMLDFDSHVSVLNWFAFDIFDGNFVPPTILSLSE